MREEYKQLNFGLVPEQGRFLDKAVLSTIMLYNRRLRGEIDPTVWEKTADTHPRYKKKILEFRDALATAENIRIAYEVGELDDSLAADINATFLQIRKTIGSDYWSKRFCQREEVNLTLVEDIFLARCGNHNIRESSRSDEMDEIYSCITPMAILEDPDDPGDVEFPFLEHIPTSEIIRKVLKREISLKPVFPSR